MAEPFFAAVRRYAEAAPDSPSLTVGDTTLSRAELVASCERLAEGFAERGVTVGSWVTIALPNGLGFVQASLAAWLLGATPQPVSDRLPAGERTAIIELADPALVIGADADEVGGRPALSAAEVAALAGGSGVPPRREALLSPDWKVVTSGGSTGRPKLIVAAGPADAEPIGLTGLLLRVREGGCVLVTGPMSHNAPFVAMISGLLLGNHVVVLPRFDATETLRLVERHRVDWLYLVPTMMLRIWRLPEADRLAHDLSSLRIVFHMAAPCPAWLKAEWIGWLGGEAILELYGGTELQAMTVVTGTEWLAHRGTVGRPVIGEIECRDPAGGPLPAGEVGELWMRRGADEPSPYRYVGATPKSAAERWESLGDLGYLDADGYVYITDRDTDMILVGGANVYPAEIEAAIEEHPAVRSSCVIGLPHPDLGNVPHALVQVVADVPDAELDAHLRARLASYKVPRTYERVAEPLREDSGKVRRSALRAARLPAAVAPGTPSTDVGSPR